MAIFVGDPQVFLTICKGSIIFFLLQDMSVMCLSLLTNSVGLTVKELELIPNRSLLLCQKTRPERTALLLRYRVVIRGGGWGAVAPKENEKMKTNRKKRKKREKRETRKKGTMNSVKLLHIKCCFFQFFNNTVALKN